MSSLTRADVESVLIRRAGKLMTKVGLDGVTISGANLDLNDPIRRAARQIGVTVSDPILVADADLASLVCWQVEYLLDVAELRLLESIWENWTEVSQAVSLGKIEAQQLADRIEKRIDKLEERIRKPYGRNIGLVSGGSIRHGRHIPANVRVTPPYGNGPPENWNPDFSDPEL